MKRKWNRYLISLLLGLCLLMPSQMKVLAADAQEDSSSVQAVEEAVPDQENSVTEEKNQIVDDQMNGQPEDMKEEKSVQDVVAEEKEEDTQVYAENYPATGNITAKVYLRYSNSLPEKINQDFGETEFGPSGNNVPYFTVTVDLDKLNQKPVKAYVKSYYGTQFIYYSIDSDSTWNPDGTIADKRVENAANLWEQAILQAMSASDQKKFESVFGNNMFVGYVLKRENNGWHIDGILKKDPPIYVVELYDQNEQALFAIASNDTKLPGVSYQDFKKKVEEELGGTNYNYLSEQRDQIVLTYEKDGKIWKATIVPKTNGKDKEYAGVYHVDPVNGKFSYRTVSKDTYYLSRMTLSVQEITPVDLTISKIVKGSAANPQEHFTFVITASRLAGKTLQVQYSGTQDCTEKHEAEITFDQSGTARIAVKNGESARIQNVMSGDIRILEESGNYWTSVTVDGNQANYNQKQGIDVTISKSSVIAAFTNQMEQQPVTGIGVMTSPYLPVLLAGIALLTGWYVKRKKNI